MRWRWCLPLSVVLTVAGAVPAVAQISVPRPDPTDLVDIDPGDVDIDPGEVAEVPSSAAEGEELVGLFHVTEGECSADGISSGSFFQMAQKNADPKDGPYVENTDSPCDNKEFSPLLPGSDGGMFTGTYQPNPSQPFRDGNGTAGAIVKPTTWFGVDFAASTNRTDPQTKTEVAAPVVIHDGSNGLSGDVRAFSAAWNGEHFNQGSPKPDGKKPGFTAGPSGTYDGATGAYTLEWSSTINGGPFDGFTGTWHLEGTFEEGVGGGTASGSGGSSGSSGSAEPQPQSGGAETSGEGETAASGQSLPNTGPAIPPGLAPLLVGLGGAGLITDRIRRRHLERKR